MLNWQLTREFTMNLQPTPTFHPTSLSCSTYSVPKLTGIGRWKGGRLREAERGLPGHRGGNNYTDELKLYQEMSGWRGSRGTFYHSKAALIYCLSLFRSTEKMADQQSIISISFPLFLGIRTKHVKATLSKIYNLPRSLGTGRAHPVYLEHFIWFCKICKEQEPQYLQWSRRGCSNLNAQGSALPGGWKTPRSHGQLWGVSAPLSGSSNQTPPHDAHSSRHFWPNFRAQEGGLLLLPGLAIFSPTVRTQLCNESLRRVKYIIIPSPCPCPFPRDSDSVAPGRCLGIVLFGGWVGVGVRFL